MDGSRRERRGLYEPGSVTWRVNQESALLLGGGRALLLQLAHPLVAAGVARHSDFRERPLGRLTRTLRLTLSMVFGTLEEAAAAAREINAAHRPVHGVLSDGSGGVGAGTPYSARDPELLLWVHATLVDSAVVTYETFVGPLSRGDREAYLVESRLVGEMLGIRARAFHAGWGPFQEYLARMYAGPVRVSDEARALSRGVLNPGLSMVPRLAYTPWTVITAGLLPDPVRRGYGLAWGARERALFRAARAALPPMLKVAPATLRVMAASRRAARAARSARPGSAAS
ncbi:MAG: oxygenase MpaB family protein [Candidatus Dormibacterales bacterium]